MFALLKGAWINLLALLSAVLHVIMALLRLLDEKR